MTRPIVFSLAAVLVLFASTVSAGTIFTWTDADGVRRYANSQPPEEAENVQTIEEVQYDAVGTDRSRQAYDRMVKEASRDADRHFEQQARKKTRQAEARQRQQQEENARQIDAQRAEQLKEIDAIQQRGYSPTFTKGMQENLIREVQEKIAQLKRGAGS